MVSPRFCEFEGGEKLKESAAAIPKVRERAKRKHSGPKKIREESVTK